MKPPSQSRVVCLCGLVVPSLIGLLTCCYKRDGLPIECWVLVFPQAPLLGMFHEKRSSQSKLRRSIPKDKNEGLYVQMCVEGTGRKKFDM